MKDKKKDILITTLSKDKKIHGYFCNIKNTTTHAQQAHGLNIISTAVLCRAMAASTLLSGNLKNKSDVLALNWNCTGPVGKIAAEISFEGKIRGYVGEKNLDFIEDSISPEKGITTEPYIGFGELIVSRYTFDNRAPYNSVTIIETGEIAQDISLYLDQSLQIQSALNLGLSIDKTNKIESCGGLLLMAMPGADIEDLEKIYDSFNALGSLTDILNHDMKKINDLFETLHLEIINSKEITYNCNCNRTKIHNVLKGLSNDELKEYITKNNVIEVDCQYCSKRYSFKLDDLKTNLVN